MKTVLGIALGAAAAGAAAAYVSRNRTQVKRATNTVKGAAHAVTPHRHEQMDDATLADRVRSEIFRDAHAPKGGVSVDVQAGVAYLRGEVPDEDWAERFGKEARKVTGIDSVKNLLHTPGTPTPTAEPRSVASEKYHNSLSRAPGWPSPGQGASTINRRASLRALAACRSLGSKTAALPAPPACPPSSTSPSMTTT